MNSECVEESTEQAVYQLHFVDKAPISSRLEAPCYCYCISGIHQLPAHDCRHNCSYYGLKDGLRRNLGIAGPPSFARVGDPPAPSPLAPPSQTCKVNRPALARLRA